MKIRRIVSVVALAGSSAAFGATKVSIVPREATIPSCGCATFQLFLEDTASSGFPLRVFQMTLPGAAEPVGTASGVVEHTPIVPAVRSTGVGCLDDQSPCVNVLNPDYVFAPSNQALASKDAGPPPRFGALGLTPNDAVDVTVPRYLGELVYCASPGASGDFAVNLVDIGGASFLRIQIDPDAVDDLPFAVDVPGATIHVVELAGAVFVDRSAVDGANLGSDWSNAFVDLQTAIAYGACSGSVADEVWVASAGGSPYTPTGAGGDRAASFELVSGLALYGGFTGTETNRNQRDPALNETILSGDLDGNDGPGLTGNDENSYHVLRAEHVDASALIDGFTITGGNADGATAPDDGGGGMYVSRGGPTITGCTFVLNTGGRGGGMLAAAAAPTVNDSIFTGNVAANGGGVYSANAAAPRFSGCAFIDNSSLGAGGGLYNSQDTQPQLFSCTLRQNTAVGDGGGMFNTASSPTLSECVVLANAASNGGGIANQNGSSLSAFDSVFAANTAAGGGGAIGNSLNSSVSAVGCVFSGNQSARGGAVAGEDGGAIALINSVCHGNSATQEGGAVYAGLGSVASVTNTILWGDTAPLGAELAATGAAILRVAHCDATGGEAAVHVAAATLLWEDGNIDAPPLFVDSDGADDAAGSPDDDFRLRSGSPCIDAGSNTIDQTVAGSIPDAAIHKGGYAVPLTDTDVWKQASLFVGDAYFGNRQGGGADLRLTAGVGSVIVIDVLQVADEAAAESEYVAIDLGDPDVEDGITHPQPPDGTTVVTTAGLRFCRSNLDPLEDRFIYFAVDDAFAVDGSRPGVVVSIEYFDFGFGVLGLQYDANPWALRPLPQADFDGNERVVGDVVDIGAFEFRPVAVSAAGPRYLRATPAYGAEPVALLVTSVDEPCVESYAQAPTFVGGVEVSRLGASPIFMAPMDWGTIHISDTAILPDTSYSVVTETAGGALSATVTVTTWSWTDANHSGTGTDFDDILCVLNGFAGDFLDPCMFFGTDLEAGITNGVIDFDDVVAALSAFAGNTYFDNPEHVDPCP